MPAKSCLACSLLTRLPQSCPGRKPSFSVVKRPARPYKSAIQNRYTVGNAKGAEPPRAGPDRQPEAAPPFRAAGEAARLDVVRRDHLG